MDVADEIIMVPIDKIIPYEKNPRKNSKTVELLVKVIPKVGFNVPLVLDTENVIVKGHARWLAAKQLGMTEVPCIYSYADPETIKADRIAARCFTDNEAAFAATDEWDSRFYTLWTRKEAYSKYTGLGLEQIMKREDVLERKDVSFLDLRLDDGCFCAVCTGIEEGDASDEIQISYGKQDR